jgi:hypothetical protein
MTASATRARHASTALPTVTVTSLKNWENSSAPGAPTAAVDAAGAAAVAAVGMPRTLRAASSLIGISFTAWNAIRRFSAPISSRTFG